MSCLARSAQTSRRSEPMPENPALFDPALVALRFELRHPHTDQRAHHTAYGSANSQARQARHNRAGRYEGSKAWNG